MQAQTLLLWQPACMGLFLIVGRTPDSYLSQVKSVSVAMRAVLSGAQGASFLLEYVSCGASVSHVGYDGIEGVRCPLFAQRRICIVEEEFVAGRAL